MKRAQEWCRECVGRGHKTIYRLVEFNGTGGTAQSEETICESCNGKGYLEYAVFTIEEAKAILKHCGLTTES